MQNPIQGIRKQLEEQAGIEKKEETKTQAEVSVLQELKRLHEGWLGYAVTIEVMAHLQEKISETEKSLQKILPSPQVSDSLIRSATTELMCLKSIYNYLLTLNK